MFAVIKTGGKQYRVAENDVIQVEKLAAAAGDTVALDQVLMIGDDNGQTVGTPLVAGALVGATVLEQTRADKIIVFKKKRRKTYRRKAGHRQHLTVLRIQTISPDGKGVVAKAAAKKPTAEIVTETETAKKTETAKVGAPKAESAKKAPAKKPATEKAPATKKAATKKPAAKKAEAAKTATKTPAAKKPAAKKPAASKAKKED